MAAPKTEPQAEGRQNPLQTPRAARPRRPTRCSQLRQPFGSGRRPSASGSRRLLDGERCHEGPGGHWQQRLTGIRGPLRSHSERRGLGICVDGIHCVRSRWCELTRPGSTTSAARTSRSWTPTGNSSVSAPFPVTICGDSLTERTETFEVDLTSAADRTIAGRHRCRDGDRGRRDVPATLGVREGRHDRRGRVRSERQWPTSAPV